MKYCNTCLYPETKQDLFIDSNGVCAACLAFNNRSNIDWQAREAELKNIVHKIQCYFI